MKEAAPRELLKKVRYIEIKASHLVEDMVAGQYASTFKGAGIEFEEVREYQPGDEVRSIDWNVSARMGRPYVKEFVEERELTVMLLVDVSPSARFGTAGYTKAEVIAELVAVLALSAVRNNDKVGLLSFTEDVEVFLPPRKGRRHVLKIIREVLYRRSEGRGTNITAALEYLNRIMKRRSVAFLISDFLTLDFSKAIKLVGKRHDIIPIVVEDPWEVELPSIGLIQVEDMEDGERMLLDTQDHHVRERLRRLYEADVRERKEIFQAADLDWIEVRTDEPYMIPLRRFFRRRKRGPH